MCACVSGGLLLQPIFVDVFPFGSPARSPSAMEPSSSLSTFSIVLGSLRGADQVGLCSDADLARMARAVVATATRRPRVSYGSPSCPGCGCSRQKPVFNGSALAWVLDVGGLKRVDHVSRRCQSRVCSLRGQRLWANFSSKDKVHTWRSPVRALPQIIMLDVHFGVTKAWYQQFTMRLVKQHTSFHGEAEVHLSSQLPGYPCLQRLKSKLFKVWTLCRWLERAWERTTSVVSVNLTDTLEDTIGRSFAAYYVAMRHRRARLARQIGVDVERQGLDGHQKLTRRVCSVARACQLKHAGLGRFALTDCCDTPAFKQALCRKHCGVRAEMEENVRCKVRRVSWKAPLGEKIDDLVNVWVQEGDQPVRRSSFKDLRAGDFERYLVGASVPASDAIGCIGDSREAESFEHIADVRDDVTLQELASLSCTTHKMKPTRIARPRRKRKNNRSGGFLVSVTPEGFVTDAFEFMGAESCVQRYFFVARLKELFPELKVVFHDDACHLRRFAHRYRGVNALAASIAYPAMRYILDRFHAPGHVDPWCLANCHPENDENKGCMTGVNSQSCEILFQWLARYKHIFRKMNRWTANFFIQEVVSLHNDSSFAAYGASTKENLPQTPSSSSASSSRSSSSSDSSTS